MTPRLALLLATLLLPSTAKAQAPAPRTYALIGGQWFTGTAFERRTMYSVNGVFTSTRPAAIDSEIDLRGHFVVPPFGDAHNHDLGDSTQLDAKLARHLREGVFYKQNMHYVRALTLPILERVNTPASVDVAYAHGGLTAPGGHAVGLYDGIVGRGALAGWTKADLDTRAYFLIGNEADLDAKWPLVLAGRPDFVKIYLEYSEEYEKRRTDPAFYGRRGLDPTLVPRIARDAHAAGLRVAAHIETAADFHLAVASGVDVIAHLPGYQIPNGSPTASFEISNADAQLAAARGTIVVTTTLLSNGFYRNDTAGLARVKANQARNLALLKREGVRIALGSDSWGDTSVGEAMNLRALGIFDNAELLRLWSEATPQSIFPKRKIGKLADGHEASFITLEANPLDDFANVRRVRLRFKQGALIP